MTARLTSKYLRFADVPKGTFEQIERRLESSGCTPALLIYFLRNPDLMRQWVEAGEQIVEEDMYFSPTPLIIPDDGSYAHLTRLPDNSWLEAKGRTLFVGQDFKRLVILHQPNQKIWEVNVTTDEWTGLGGLGVEIQHIAGTEYQIRLERPGN